MPVDSESSLLRRRKKESASGQCVWSDNESTELRGSIKICLCKITNIYIRSVNLLLWITAKEGLTNRRSAHVAICPFVVNKCKLQSWRVLLHV